MITRYGMDVFLKSLLLAAAVLVGALVFVRNDVARYVIVGMVGVAAALIVNFFRDPDRTPPAVSDAVISPADGRVVLIREVHEPQYLKRDAVLVSIFMSPLDVHVNRFPISGTVELLEHHDGEYMVASDEKSSEKNERTLIGIRNDRVGVLFKQIAGAVARRIVTDVTVGQRAVAGERFGMIKFGSRVDILLPKEATVAVKLHDRVVAGETIVARYG